MPRVIAASCLLATFLSVGCLQSDQERFIESGGKVLDGNEARKAFSGNTMTGTLFTQSTQIAFTVFLGADGRTSGKAMGDSDRGTWRVSDDGKVCMTWKRWQDRKESCSVYYRKDNEFKVFFPEGGTASASTIAQGNPRNLELRSDEEVVRDEGSSAVLTADEVKQELSGNTLSGSLKLLNDASYHAFYSPDGKIAAQLSGMVNDRDVGTWHVKDTGEVCIKWSKWNESTENCSPMYRNRKGKQLSSFTPEGSLAMVGVPREGNPEKLTF